MPIASTRPVFTIALASDHSTDHIVETVLAGYVIKLESLEGNRGFKGYDEESQSL